MLTDLLDGSLPNLQDILLIQSSILEARDIYQPWRLGKQLLETRDLEVRRGVRHFVVIPACLIMHVPHNCQTAAVMQSWHLSGINTS